jgi:hypothetical protein
MRRRGDVDQFDARRAPVGIAATHAFRRHCARAKRAARRSIGFVGHGEHHLHLNAVTVTVTESAYPGALSLYFTTTNATVAIG